MGVVGCGCAGCAGCAWACAGVCNGTRGSEGLDGNRPDNVEFERRRVEEPPAALRLLLEAEGVRVLEREGMDADCGSGAWAVVRAIWQL